jgi:hypothetical protein
LRWLSAYSFESVLEDDVEGSADVLELAPSTDLVADSEDPDDFEFESMDEIDEAHDGNRSGPQEDSLVAEETIVEQWPEKLLQLVEEIQYDKIFGSSSHLGHQLPSQNNNSQDQSSKSSILPQASQSHLSSNSKDGWDERQLSQDVERIVNCVRLMQKQKSIQSSSKPLELFGVSATWYVQ